MQIWAKKAISAILSKEILSTQLISSIPKLRSVSIFPNLLPLSLHTGEWCGLWAGKALSVPPSSPIESSWGYKIVKLWPDHQSHLSTHQPQGRELQGAHHGGLKALPFAAPRHICLGLWVVFNCFYINKNVLNICSNSKAFQNDLYFLTCLSRENSKLE